MQVTKDALISAWIACAPKAFGGPALAFVNSFRPFSVHSPSSSICLTNDHPRCYIYPTVIWPFNIQTDRQTTSAIGRNKSITYDDTRKGKGKAVNGIPSHSYGVSLAIWDQTVLLATRHKWAHPALTPAIQAGTRFTYPGGMEGWVDLGRLLHTEMVYPLAGGHPSKY